MQTLVGVVRKANNQAEMYRSKMLEAEAAAAAAKAALATYQASSAAAAAAATARPTVWSSSTKVPHTPPANKSGVAITAVGATTSPARSSPLAGQPTAAAAAPTSTSIMSPAPKSTSAPAGSGVFLCLSGFKPGLPGYDLEVKAKLSAAANALGVTQLHGAQWDPRITHIIAPPNCRTMKVREGRGDEVETHVLIYTMPLQGAGKHPQGPLADAGAMAVRQPIGWHTLARRCVFWDCMAGCYSDLI